MPNQKMLAELNELHHDFLELGRCVEDVVAATARLFHEPDTIGTESIPIGSDSLNDQGERIAEQCQRILLLYQPVASDFRQVTMILWMVAKLEEVANLAIAISMRSEDRIVQPIPISEELSRLAESVREMIRLALDAFEDGNSALVQQVEHAHTEVNDVAERLTIWLTDTMKADSAMIEAGLSLFAVLQHLQRMADHAASLAKRVMFLLETPCSLVNQWHVVRSEPFHAHRPSC